MSNETYDEATRIQVQLRDAATALVQAQTVADQLGMLTRDSEKELESLKQQFYTEQLVLADKGALTGKNAKARAAQFTQFLTTCPDVVEAERDLQNKKTQEVNAKISVQAAQTQFTALRAVADLQSKKLELAAQIIASEIVGKQMELGAAIRAATDALRNPDAIKTSGVQSFGDPITNKTTGV